MAMDRTPEVGDIINFHLDDERWTKDVIVVKLNRFTGSASIVKYKEKNLMNPMIFDVTFSRLMAGDLVGVCKVQKTELYLTHDEVFFDK